jgi:hypothetical protein
MKRLLLLAGFTVVAGCTQPADNVAPVARLRLPALADARRPVPVDATASTDDDGAITSYTYIFGDGSPAVTRPDARVEHLFVSSGRFEVEVTVTDNAGATATARRFLTLVDNFTPPYCTGSNDCQTQQACDTDAGVCVEGP